MSKRLLYSRSMVGALTLLVVSSASAQAPQGPHRYEQVVDASYSGAPLASRPHSTSSVRGRPSVEPIRPDPLLDAKPTLVFKGDQVSMGRLTHAPPEKAMRQMKKSQEAFAAGDIERGVKKLEQAIEIHPEFIEARNNLGVQYARMGRWSDALDQFEYAAELDPAAPLPHLNLSMALQALGEADAAVINAEEAIRLAPHDPGAHYNLGAILAQQGRRLADAVRHLSRAEERYPAASLVKAEALLQQGDADAAQISLRTFLSSTPVEPLR